LKKNIQLYVPNKTQQHTYELKSENIKINWH